VLQELRILVRQRRRKTPRIEIRITFGCKGGRRNGIEIILAHILPTASKEFRLDTSTPHDAKRHMTATELMRMSLTAAQRLFGVFLTVTHARRIWTLRRVNRKRAFIGELDG